MACTGSRGTLDDAAPGATDASESESDSAGESAFSGGDADSSTEGGDESGTETTASPGPDYVCEVEASAGLGEVCVPGRIPCDEGLKCAASGLDPLVIPFCIPVVAEPDPVGALCTLETTGPNMDGRVEVLLDSCDENSVCKEGTIDGDKPGMHCWPVCTYDEDCGRCEGRDDLSCLFLSGGCLPECDPRNGSADCTRADRPDCIVWISDISPGAFGICGVHQSGPAPEGGACNLSPSGCEVGTVCVPSLIYGPACRDTGDCCSSLCEVGGDACPQPDQKCVPLPPSDAPLDGLGVCSVTEDLYSASW